MKVKRVVMLNDKHAVIHLSPSWLARLFGAPDVVAQLEWVDIPRWGEGWRCSHTHVNIDYMTHGLLLKYALQFQPLETKALEGGGTQVDTTPVDGAGVVSLPRARIFTLKE